MKFNCGLTSDEKYAARMNYLQNWHSFFCLLPKRIGETHECRWLETIECRGTFKSFPYGSTWIWEYRLKSNYSEEL